MRERDSSSDMKDWNRIQPITIRSLESLIRLSTAYAKIWLSDIVEV